MLVKNPVAFDEKVYNTKYFVNVKLSGSGNPGSDTCDYTGTFFFSQASFHLSVDEWQNFTSLLLTQFPHSELADFTYMYKSTKGLHFTGRIERRRI